MCFFNVSMSPQRGSVPKCRSRGLCFAIKCLFFLLFVFFLTCFCTSVNRSLQITAYSIEQLFGRFILLVHLTHYWICQTFKLRLTILQFIDPNFGSLCAEMLPIMRESLSNRSGRFSNLVANSKARLLFAKTSVQKKY